MLVLLRYFEEVPLFVRSVVSAPYQEASTLIFNFEVSADK
jgi:hypothetical protein